jgi:hypothetical protein
MTSEAGEKHTSGVYWFPGSVIREPGPLDGETLLAKRDQMARIVARIKLLL